MTLLLLVCLTLLGNSAFAQSGKGALSGRVADSVDAILPGAEVILIPDAGRIVTNSQGEFHVTNLAPGAYEVHINYVGFEPFSQNVTITAGQTTQLRALIKVQGKAEEVTVLSGRQSGEIEAINETRAAENILQVLPAEVITSLPNANIADALGRMPSVTIERDEGEGKYVQVRGTQPRLTNVMVDGITIPSPESGVRQIKLDTIASDLVDAVEINKTLQANIDGDGIGGSVNLRTKTAGETPTLNLYGIGGYTPILKDGRNIYQGGGTLGQRFGAQKKLGLLIGGTYDYNGRGINDIEPGQTVYGDGYANYSATPHYDSIDLRDYVYDRTRWGATASADYKLGNGSSVYLRGLFSTFRNWGHKWVFTLQDNNDPTGFDTGKPKYSQDWRRPNMAIGNLTVGGKHVFANSWLAWDIAAGRSRSEGGSGSAKYKWNGDKNIPCWNDQSVATSVYRPGWSSGCFGTGVDNAVDSNNFYLSSLTLPNSAQSAQVNLTGSISYAQNYRAGSHFGTLEVGGKIRNAHKYDNTYQIVADLSPFSKSQLMVSANSGWASGFTDPNYYDKTYHIGPVTDYSKVRAWALAAGLFPAGQNVPNSANYDYIERVSAGYVMNTIDLSSRLRLVTGVRFEQTHFDGKGFDNTLGTVTQKVGFDYLDVLPSASLRYSLDKDSGLRLVYGRGLGRPDPTDMVQTSTPVDNSQNPAVVTLSNPNLKAEYADNFDVLYERYLKPSGLFQAGFFFKEISDPIVNGQYLSQNYIDSSGKAWGKTMISQVDNVGSAHLLGLEVSYQQRLTFLPSVMHGLGLSANYSYTASKVNNLTNLGRSDSPALQRQAPNTWNISPTYDTKKFSMRLGMTYNDAMIYAYQWQDGADPVLGSKGPSGDNYLYPHMQIDVQASYKLPWGLQVYGYGLNLNNEVFGFYNGSPQYMNQREYYKPTFAGGLRYEFSREH
jgi:TonB-dependent receptor